MVNGSYIWARRRTPLTSSEPHFHTHPHTHTCKLIEILCWGWSTMNRGWRHLTCNIVHSIIGHIESVLCEWLCGMLTHPPTSLPSSFPPPLPSLPLPSTLESPQPPLLSLPLPPTLQYIPPSPHFLPSYSLLAILPPRNRLFPLPFPFSFYLWLCSSLPLSFLCIAHKIMKLYYIFILSFTPNGR